MHGPINIRFTINWLVFILGRDFVLYEVRIEFLWAYIAYISLRLPNSSKNVVTASLKMHLDVFRHCMLPLEELRAWRRRCEFSKTEAYYYCVTNLEGAQRLFVIVWTRTRGLIELLLHVRAVTTWHNTRVMGVQLSHMLPRSSVSIKCSAVRKMKAFDVLLTVHLSIILVINQLNAQILVL